MDMADNKTMGKRPYGVHEDISGNRLDDVLHKFRAIGLDALPLLCAADSLIGDGVSAEFVDTHFGFHIAELPTRGQDDEQHPAAVTEPDTMRLRIQPLADGGFHRIVHIPPELHDIRIGGAPGIHKGLEFLLGKPHFQSAHASTDALQNDCVDPRFKYVIRGSAEYVEWLGQQENPQGKGWAAGAGYGEKILTILKNICGTAGGASGTADIWYRVRKTWADAKSQVGAFRVLENAKNCADENPGYCVFDVNGVNIYTPKEVSFSPYLVRVSITDLNIRKGPGTNYAKTGKFTGKGVFTIVEMQTGKGSDTGWGRLKSGAGWISLDYTEKIS